MKSIKGLSARFWDQVIIDGLLGNNDRNNGNWGIIVGPKSLRIAPVFDNGASFYPKKSEDSIKKASSVHFALKIWGVFTLSDTPLFNFFIIVRRINSLQE